MTMRATAASKRYVARPSPWYLRSANLRQDTDAVRSAVVAHLRADLLEVAPGPVGEVHVVSAAQAGGRFTSRTGRQSSASAMAYAAREPELKSRAGSGRSGDMDADPATHRGNADDASWPKPVGGAAGPDCSVRRRARSQPVAFHARSCTGV
jgi:hypothetical protein